MKITKPHVNVGVIGHFDLARASLTAAMFHTASHLSNIVIVVPNDISKPDLRRVINELLNDTDLYACVDISVEHELKIYDSKEILATLAKSMTKEMAPPTIVGQPYPLQKKHIPLKIGPKKQFSVRVRHSRKF